MPFRKKTARDQFEARLEDFLTQAEDLRVQASHRAPEVREAALARLETGLEEVRTRWPGVRDDLLERVPELNQQTYDKLPDAVSDRLPEQVKPTRKRSALRTVVVGGLLAGAGAAAVAMLRSKKANQSTSAGYTPPQPVRPPTSNGSPTGNNASPASSSAPSAGGPLRSATDSARPTMAEDLAKAAEAGRRDNAS